LKTSDDSGAASVDARSARQRSGVRELRGVETAPLITVLTPTYNRAHLLGRVYESLLAQTFPPFEWIIVDDGSEDDTEALVQSWIDEGALEILYRRQANLGKFAAVNRGVELARGEFTTIVDSDDWLVPDSLERQLAHWRAIPEGEQQNFSGVVGLCAYEDGRIVGDPFPFDPLDCDPAELTYVHGVAGDKHGLLRTAVFREFPFPFEGASDPPGLVWNRMALKYRERHVNQVVKIVEYQPGGLSDDALKLQIRTPLPMRQFLLEELRLPHRLPLRRRLRSYANYTRFSLHARLGVREQAREAPSTAIWGVIAPLGTILYIRDRLRFAGPFSRFIG
jgi:glycosyltransferase involved in cell wall biosynthesis